MSRGNMKVSLMCRGAADVGRKGQQVEWLYLGKKGDYIFFHVDLVKHLLLVKIKLNWGTINLNLN